MVSITKKTYRKSAFRKVLKSKTDNGCSLKNDSCDLLVYLIYLNYINRLTLDIEDSQRTNGNTDLNKEQFDEINDKLMRQYKG